MGKSCRWKHPRAPSVKLLWEGRAAEAVLDFLRDTRVGYGATVRRPPEEEGEDRKCEEDGPGLPI